MSYRDEETLKELYIDKDLDQQEIADQFNVNQTTISRWINKYDIRPPLRDEELLRDLYTNKGLSVREVAEEIGCWPGSVGKALDRHGIETRQSYQDKVPHFNQANEYGHECWTHLVDGTHRTIYVHRLLAVAEYGFEEVKSMDIHHINGIPWDNRPENIKPVTREEHNKIHEPERDELGRFSSG